MKSRTWDFPTLASCRTCVCIRLCAFPASPRGSCSDLCPWLSDEHNNFTCHVYTNILLRKNVPYRFHSLLGHSFAEHLDHAESLIEEVVEELASVVQLQDKFARSRTFFSRWRHWPEHPLPPWHNPLNCHPCPQRSLHPGCSLAPPGMSWTGRWWCLRSRRSAAVCWMPAFFYMCETSLRANTCTKKYKYIYIYISSKQQCSLLLGSSIKCVKNTLTSANDLCSVSSTFSDTL